MSRSRRCLSLLVFAALLLPIPAAHALPLLDIDVGVKGGVNAAYLAVEPNFDNDWARTLYEGDDAFGVSGSGGLYGQVRLWKAVGLELDVLISRDQTKRTEKFSVGAAYVKLDHTDWATSLRVPVLLKGFWALGPVSLSLGVGPEWVRTLDHGHDLEEGESLNANLDPAALETYRDSLHSVAKDSLFLTGQLELAIELGFITIPIDLRVGRNLSQTDRFEDRYDYDATVVGNTVKVNSAEIQSIYSWDFRFLTGIAASF